MYALIDKLSSDIKAFLDQRDAMALALSSTEVETPVIWKTLESVEVESPSELFWMFEMPFVDAASYVASIVDAFRQRHEMVRLLQPDNGMEPWPAIPESIDQLGAQPLAQLKGLMQFSRELLPEKAGFLCVWALYPFQIESRPLFAAFMSALLEHEFPFPWLHGLRIIFRQEAGDQAMAKVVSTQPRLMASRVDFSSSSLTKAIDEEIDNDDLPLERRMQSVMVSAGMDFSHRRYFQALDKYQLLFKYYGLTGDRAQLAVALNGIGETQMALGQDSAAHDSFLSAMLPASEGANFPVPVLTNVLLNLAGYYEKHLQWSEAESCLMELQKLAALQRNPQLKVHMLERLGDAQRQQGKRAEAIATWSAGDHVATELEITAQQPSVLERLRNAYTESGDWAKANQASQRLSELTSGATDV